jgi:hypothetical protein
MVNPCFHDELCYSALGSFYLCHKAKVHSIACLPENRNHRKEFGVSHKRAFVRHEDNSYDPKTNPLEAIERVLVAHQVGCYAFIGS